MSLKRTILIVLCGETGRVKVVGEADLLGSMREMQQIGLSQVRLSRVFGGNYVGLGGALQTVKWDALL